MNKLNILTSLILYLNFASGYFDLRENDICPSHETSEGGICMDARKCEAFSADRNHLGICSFKGRIPIVCCPGHQLSDVKIGNIDDKRISALSKL